MRESVHLVRMRSWLRRSASRSGSGHAVGPRAVEGRANGSSMRAGVGEALLQATRSGRWSTIDSATQHSIF